MDLTQEQIEKINKEVPYDLYSDAQGVFVQPNGVPVDVKGPVIYMRYETGGWRGGSCWDDSDPQPYIKEYVPEFVVLDKVLEELHPSITYLQYKKISNLIHSNEETEREYYGNSTEYMVKYIILFELIELLESFN